MDIHEVLSNIKVDIDRPDLFYYHFVNNLNQDLMENMMCAYIYDGYLMLGFLMGRVYATSSNGIWGMSTKELSNADIIKMFDVFNDDNLPDLKVEYVNRYGEIMSNVVFKNPKFEKIDLEKTVISLPIKVDTYGDYCLTDTVPANLKNEVTKLVYKVSYSDLTYTNSK